ncbi:MAG: ChbG/HpnK family deacetylase [Desulfobacteraceae bacterium]|jgi:predicted glycoside hydrolase/deacetylase ChbG (UPF0249 family)|nr:ChbG/HpnK family deacetylase [Desulfobacteraceae bacterium]
MVARLILHSDDFGLHPAVNRAIIEAFTHGCLTSASLMANGLAVEDAISGALRYPDFGVGVHLNILRGRPLSPPSEIPSLVDDRGFFLNSAAVLLCKSFMGKISKQQVYLEYRRQILFLKEQGIRLTHLDGEKHTHLLLPEAVWAVKKLTKEFGIPKVRIINETALMRTLFASGSRFYSGLMQRLKLFLLENRSRKALQELSDIKHTDLTFGVLISGSIDYKNSYKVLTTLLSMDADVTIEWMFHLGYPFNIHKSSFKTEFGSFFLNEQREKELHFFLS